MGSKKKSSNSSSQSNSNSNHSAPMSARVVNSAISGLREKHQQELENLTLTSQPCRTLKFFIFAINDYVKQSLAYLLAKGGWLLVLSTLIVTCGVLLATIEGSHEKHVQEFLQYLQFGLWWIALGVASSIGLGSGLHTFVLYLGPHIALFTIKAMQCGRVDLKSAPYDTIQLKRGPSWLDKDCSEFGPPLFKSVYGSRVPLSSILPQVQLEAILWGVGTALGELPPYFISRAASMSGSKLDAMEELDVSSSEGDGAVGNRLMKLKHWLISHSQYLNSLTILLLASIPNPLFDLAGIMCGQLGIPFWKFFLATLVGKAIIKTFIQTVFIISVCNNQLLDWVENELIWVLSHIPGVASVLPHLLTKLHAVKDKYLATATPVAPKAQVAKWGLSFSTIWNTVVWLVLVNFLFKIVNTTAQGFLKKEQEKEVNTLTNKSSSSKQLNRILS
uniref:Vacuole membrane protein KMS1 n=1 Tax=Opuntia streptacantha TaxID=393608 RepID=A0A7C9ACS1_OPUST